MVTRGFDEAVRKFLCIRTQLSHIDNEYLDRIHQCMAWKVFQLVQLATTTPYLEIRHCLQYTDEP
jgi:hypothetical protein